jgi:hypothetical protein
MVLTVSLGVGILYGSYTLQIYYVVDRERMLLRAIHEKPFVPGVWTQRRIIVRFFGNVHLGVSARVVGHAYRQPHS